MTAEHPADTPVNPDERVHVVLARPDILSESAFERLRASVPAQRRARADRYHHAPDRYASVVAFSLLQHLWQVHGTGPLPDVVRERHGKPRFADPNGWHFNWSHTRSVCVCVLGPVPLGVDVQSPVRYDDGLFARIAAPGELHLADRLRAAGDLSAVWSRKEAAVKRTGRGLSTPLDEVDTAAADDILTLSSADPECHISISADGCTAQNLWPRLRMSFLRSDEDQDPGRGPWIQAPIRPPHFAVLSRTDWTMTPTLP